MKGRTGDTLFILALYLLSWATVNLPILASPLGSYPVVDGEWHHAWAREVASGNLFIYAPFFRAPLYPWLLGGWYALAGPGAAAGALFSMAAGAGTAVLLHRLGLRCFSRWKALVTAGIWSLWGTSLLYSGFLLIEPLYILLLVASFHALCRRPDIPLPWFLLGAACIARPGAVLLLPVSIYLFRPRFRSWVAWAVPVGGVFLVNALNGDPGTVISSQGGVNFYIGSGPEADGVTAFAPPGGKLPSDSLPYIDNVWAASLEPLPEGSAPSRVSAHWTAKTVRHITSQPVRFMVLLAEKAAYLLSPVEMPCNYDVYYMGRYSAGAGLLISGPPAALPGILLWALLPGALAAGRLSSPERKLLLWVLTLAAGLMPFFITARFRLPMMPFLLLLLTARFLRKPVRGALLSPLGIAGGACLALLTAPMVPRSGVNMPFHDGMAHFEAGRGDQARNLFIEAWERASSRTDGVDLNGTDALFNLGVMALQDGDPDAAVFWFEKALEWNPGHEPSRRNLVVLTRQWQ